VAIRGISVYYLKAWANDEVGRHGLAAERQFQQQAEKAPQNILIAVFVAPLLT
jgi:hypothetical protein